MSPPAAFVGITPTFFTSKSTMWPGQRATIRRGMRFAFPDRVEEAAAVEPEVGQVPTDRALGGEFQGDAAGRPLAVPPQPLDPDDNLGRGRDGLSVRSAGAVSQAGLAEAAIRLTRFEAHWREMLISAATWSMGRVRQRWTRRV